LLENPFGFGRKSLFFMLATFLNFIVSGYNLSHQNQIKNAEMKNLISSVFILAILGSCSKETQNTIPDPPVGTYEVIFYNQDNNVVFTRKGNAFYADFNNGTQIRLTDPDPVQTFSTNAKEVAYIFLQINHKLNSPVTMDTSSFYGYVAQGRYIDDWGYRTQTGQLKITEIAQDKIRGEFTITVTSVNGSNPNWGDRITIKGKFYAR
jgi:hypothetical protein